MQSLFQRTPMLLVLSVLALPSGVLAQQTLGELYATDASVRGSVVLAGSGTSVLSGSSIEAGAQAATLKLERGGSLLVCPGTKLSITASQNGRSLMFSLNSGNVELNYPLGASADTLLTPDLRLLMPGPGTVHAAVRVTPQGDTCVQALPSNASAIVVSEVMDDTTYQVKPDERVFFRAGHLNSAVRMSENCGCPAPPPTQVAKAVAVPRVPAETQPQPSVTQASAKPAEPPAAAVASPPPDQHLAVEAPFVFRGSDPVPDLTQNVATLKLESNKLVPLEPVVLPPASPAGSDGSGKTSVAKKEAKHGFFSRVGAFFATLFH